MKTALVVLALFFGSATVVIPQAPQQTAAVDGKQYVLLPYVLVNRQSYEKVCGPFYWSNVLGEGSELIGFRFTRDGKKVEDVVVHAKSLSVMVDEATALPTAQEVSKDDGGHYVLRMNARDHSAYTAEHGCLAGVEQMK
jgi:hypothetical protein